MVVQLNPPTSFSTKRLLLRRTILEDAEPIFHSYASKPHIPKYMSWVAHKHVSETVDFIKHLISLWDDKTSFEYVIELNENEGIPVGMIGMHPLRDATGFGYVIAEEFWNRGYMSEALKTLVDWSLVQEGVFRAQAFCAIENHASARVMEKAGMIFEGRLKRYFIHPNISAEPLDCLMYAKTV